MICYRLICDQAHTFDSWFRSSLDFEMLCETSSVECAICGSRSITRMPMAPTVQTKEKPDQHRQIRTLRQEFKKTFTNVGLEFPKEARLMHYGEKKHTPIYGKSSPDEIRDLVDEGIGILPLGFDPDAKEN